MKSFKKPEAFDGGKFAKRYGLDAMRDFYEQDGVIVFPDTLPDEPVFEAPDAAKPTVDERLSAVETAIASVQLDGPGRRI